MSLSHPLVLAMGSLMAGWSSNPSDAQKVTDRSKSSLTNDDIEAYRRARQLAMEEHSKEAAAQNASESSDGTPAIAIPAQVFKEVQQPIASSPDWWTRSNWAFLNDPPDGDLLKNKSRYTPQFDMAAQSSNSQMMYTQSSSFSPIP